MSKRKRTNNDLKTVPKKPHKSSNTIYSKNWDELMCSGRVSSSSKAAIVSFVDGRYPHNYRLYHV